MRAATLQCLPRAATAEILAAMVAAALVSVLAAARFATTAHARKSGGRADRSPFSKAGHQPSNKERGHALFGTYSPHWGYDHRTPEERRAGMAGIKRGELP
jgi:hypothetical protein